MGFEPGATLGTFEIAGLLGKGGMGEVYRATDTRLEREVAIKVLPASFAQDAERLARFEREAKILASLNHPHIASLYDMQQDGDIRFIVMELIEGETLEDRIKRSLMPIEEALPLFAQIAEGLKIAHEQGIIHRDLKPANIKITQDGRAKVLDFGLAASCPIASNAFPNDSTTPGSPPAPLVTSDGTILGTPSYMSPEQARGKPLDKRTDVWAFGCCLFEALTGQAPFHGETTTDTLVSILEREPDWYRLPANVADGVQSLLRRCLEKDANRRLSSAGDVAVTLEDEFEALKNKTKSASSPGSPDLEAQRPKRPLPVFAAVSIGVVIAVLAGVFYGSRSSGEPDEGTGLSENMEKRTIESLAVLPFENQSGEEEQKYFVQAMTDALTNALAKISSISVISQTSTRSYRGTTKSARVIAEELGVDAIVLGSVYRADDRIRITAQLIDGQTEEHFWSGEWEADLVDIIKLQSDVTLEIATQIKAELTGDERERITSAAPVDQEAYDAAVIGQFFLNDATKEGLLTSVRYFKKAIELDPEYAHGWGGLVCAYVSFPVYGLSKPRDFYPKAQEAGLEALRLDYDMAGDQSHMGFVMMAYYWEWEQAEERFKRAIELSPSNATSYSDYALYLVHVGRGAEATITANTSMDLNPGPEAYFGQRIMSLAYLEREPQKSLIILRKILMENPDYFPALDTLALTHKYLGEYGKAVAVVQGWVEMTDRNLPSLVALARAHADVGNEDEARAILEELAATDDYFDSASSAYAFVSIGDLDSAFELLEIGFDEKDWGMVELRVSPYWKIYVDKPNWIRFRNDPRYLDLIRRMNFLPLPSSHPGYKEDQAHRALR